MVKLNVYGRGLSLRMAIMLTCQVAFVLFGYNQGVFSGIVGNQNFLALVHNPSSAVIGIIVGIYNLGCFAGTIVAFMTNDKLGFRRTMWFSMAWIMVGATVQTCAYSRTQLLVSRFVTGIGTGVMSTAVPVYQSELCDARKRGMYVCSQPLAVGVGIVLAYWFDYGMSFVDGPVNWRLPIACQLIFALVVILMVFGLPENPRWLFRRGRNEEGLRVLCDVYDRTIDDPKIVQDSQEIFKAIEMDNLRGEYRWSQLFKKDELHTGRRVLLAYGLQFMNQMGGVNIIVTYVTTVLEVNVGMGKQLSLLLGGVIQVIQAIGVSANWLWNFFVAMIGPTLIKDLQWKGYVIFMCLNLAFVPLIYFFYPETANMSLEQIDYLFTDNKRPQVFRLNSYDRNDEWKQPIVREDA
ncbi:hypothetical protein FE257_012508 [Aspergillus nanangensis]|uniref:Major facilitator superfamily (MFS) profile domain-containing protein n=1 Tax=Aspergillus nanangensis TaxID=2582783 RepID=A0AAD4GXL6_ASPNN|nr:hypothetical protein FE257_012508 [Aspergillus nanangensis]